MDRRRFRSALVLAEFGGQPAPSVEPEAVVDPVPAPDRSAFLTVAIVVATMLAVAVLFAAVVIAARRRRGQS